MNETWQVLTIIGSIAAATAILTWFMSEQFRKNRATFYRVISLHNREDDANFALLEEQIWNIHLRNARRDGDDPPIRHKLPRRRYLMDDGGELQDDTAR